MEIFKRKEQKYLISNENHKKLLEKIDKYLQKSEYFKETICNIYFDNDNNDLIITSLEKPVYKEKIRLRSYNIPQLDDKVYLEIKKKYKGIVSKRRVDMTLKEAYDYLYKNQMPKESKQIMKEIDYCFKKYDLHPALYIAYDRESYFMKGNEDFRITFDSNVRSRTDKLRLDLGCNGTDLIGNEYIMEIKSLDSMPLWLVKILNELKIYPISFSKYGEIYSKMKEEIKNV